MLRYPPRIDLVRAGPEMRITDREVKSNAMHVIGERVFFRRKFRCQCLACGAGDRCDLVRRLCFTHRAGLDPTVRFRIIFGDYDQGTNRAAGSVRVVSAISEINHSPRRRINRQPDDRIPDAHSR